MTSLGPHLTLELTRTGETTLRVVLSRSDRPAQQAASIPFRPAEAEGIAAEMTDILARAAGNGEAAPDRIKLHRLATRLAGAVLPADTLPHLSSGDLPVEFVLDDYAMAFPVEALPCGGGFLGETVPVSRRWLCDSFPCHGASASGALEMLIVADPAGTHPEARREGKEILRLMRGAAPDWNIRYLSTRVSAADLDSELPSTNLFHIAAHMERDPPGVRMADSLWLPRVGGSPPGIVVASCCRSGGLAGGGREMAGVFLRSGAGQVVAPATVVEDGLAATFSQRLYQAIARGGGLAEAVHQARASLGLAGLSFIHYGAVRTKPLLPQSPETKATGSGRRHLALLIVWVLMACIVAAWVFARYGAHEEKGERPPSQSAAPATSVPTAVKTETAEQDAARRDAAAASVPERERNNDANAHETTRDAGKGAAGKGGPRVSEKMLENF